ncbi:hypothetical protein [Mucilaginibacter sp.]|jgi:glutathione synthase/RimK-type ligase-like ATP-grasp enzyme|uniref:hypothetical protein n=1 Tax=Mucilaginibacter sp. TaxID=1882438 RepID=UPI0026046971|nr:hypothetical protein [Mucilaginibacter sp.]MDB4926598.1 hypothetical protein [Mucilaginibacter sp.]
MILIVTHKNDFTADFLINKLNNSHVSYRRLNCEDILKQPYKFNINKGLYYEFLGEQKYTAVWFRRTKLPDFSDLLHYEKLYLLNETESFLKGLFTIIDAKWLSDPFAVYKAEYKLLQLRTAESVGFTIPNTLITNSKEDLLEFYEQCDRNIIIKPIGQTRLTQKDSIQFIYTNKLTPDLLEEISQYDLTPCIYQANIEKDYELRITVVENKVFAASIDSQVDPDTITDWRRKSKAFVKIEIPQEVELMCVNLLKALNLKFGAIDMVKTKSGKYIFLEINPNGQWAWIESETNLQISEAIIDFLQA